MARSQVEARKPGLQHHMDLKAKTLTLLLVNNKDTDQPAHPGSLISAFVICYLKTRSYYILLSIFGGLQHDKASGYTPDLFVAGVCNAISKVTGVCNTTSRVAC